MGIKQKADRIAEPQCEVYSFATKYNLPEAATDELLDMLSNVSASDLMCAHLPNVTRSAVKIRFRPEDFTNKSVKTMDHADKLGTMPDYEMYSVDLHEGIISWSKL